MSETKIQSLIAAVIAVVNMLVLLDLLHLTDEQIGGINVALVAIMGAIRAWFAPEVSVIGPAEK